MISIKQKRRGLLASRLHASADLLTLALVLSLYDPPTGFILTDEMMMRVPERIILLDVLKLLSASAGLVLVLLLLRMLKGGRGLKWGSFAGLGSLLCLLLNALASLCLVGLHTGRLHIVPEQTIATLQTAIPLLGVGSLFLNGIWLLVVNRIAARSSQFPKMLRRLGMLTGLLSLLPPLSLAVLVLSIGWYLQLGLVLRRLYFPVLGNEFVRNR